jgi:hypothetical protein
VKSIDLSQINPWILNPWNISGSELIIGLSKDIRKIHGLSLDIELELAITH